MTHLVSISRAIICPSPHTGAKAIMSLHGYNIPPISPVLSWALGSGQYIPKTQISLHHVFAQKVGIE